MVWQTIFDCVSSGRMCMTLVHSLWQVALLAAVAWGFERLWRRRSVQRSYALHVAALLAALAAMPITYALVDVDMPEAVVRSEPTFDADAAPPAVVDMPGASPVVVDAEIQQPPFAIGEQPPDARDLSPVTDTLAAATVTPAAEEPANPWHRAAPWIVALYVLGVAVMLVRLVRGVWQAQRLGRNARLIDDKALLDRLDSLARRWSMRIVPVLSQAEEIVVPKVVGLLRPTILLPVAAVSGLSTDELELILAHELAHVRRYDMWVNLAQRVAEVVLFFNPALWYLSRRTSTLREYCCDELTCNSASTADPQQRVRYASALLRTVELGRAPHSSDLATLAAGGRSPSELRRRVARLFGEPLDEPLRFFSRGSLLTFVVVAALLLTAPTAWNIVADTSTSPTESTIEDNKTADIDIKDTGTKIFGGKVTDESGAAVTGADVWLSVYLKSDIKGPHVQNVKTDSLGRFTLTVPPAWVAKKILDSPVTIWVYAAGHQVGIKHANDLTKLSFEGDESDLAIQLKPAGDTSFKVLDPEGKPVAGALVQPFYRIQPTPEEVLRQIEARTDAAGWAKLPAVGRRKLDQVKIIAKGFGTQNQRYNSFDLPIPAENTIKLCPAGRIEGQLIAEKPEWAKNVRLFFITEPLTEYSPPWRAEGYAKIQTDDQGRFTVPDMASGRLIFRSVFLDEKLPVRPQFPRFVDMDANATTKLKIPMVALVPVRGTVRVKGSDEPIAGVKIEIRHGCQSVKCTSDKQGSFTAKILPSRAGFYLTDLSGKYVQLGNSEYIDIPSQTEGFVLSPIELVPTKNIEGRLVDGQDRPYADASVNIRYGNRTYGDGKSDADGRFKLTGVPATIDAVKAVYHIAQVSDPWREQLENIVIKANPLTIRAQKKAAGEPKQKQKKPPGEDRAKVDTTETVPVKGVVVDEDGQPAAGVSVRALVPGEREPTTKSDAQGRFELEVERKRARGVSIVARSAGGTRQAFFKYDGKQKADKPLPPARLTIGPARSIDVRVVNGKGEPIAVAEVGAVACYNDIATGLTNGQGEITLRIPAGAPLESIFALKSGAGLDYVAFDPKKEAIVSRPTVLTLDGAKTVRIKLLDPEVRPLAGIGVRPLVFDKSRRRREPWNDLNISAVESFQVKTDNNGVATFDWIPSWHHRHLAFFQMADRDKWVSKQIRVDLDDAKSEIKTQLIRTVPVRGQVRFADGRPAEGIQLRANGFGYNLDKFEGSARTDADGRFEFHASPDLLYMFAVTDSKWAARACSGVVVRRNTPVDGIDFELFPATRVHGQVTVGDERKPMAGERVSLVQLGTSNFLLPEKDRLPVPPETNRRISSVQPRIQRGTITDENGYYEFHAGLGDYELSGPAYAPKQEFSLGKQKSRKIDLHATRQDRGVISGKVVFNGENSRPVVAAKVVGVSLDRFGLADLFEKTDKQGRFRTKRRLDRMAFFAKSVDGKFTGIAKVSADDKEVTISLEPAASVKGRLVDAADGKPLPGRKIDYGLIDYYLEPDKSRSGMRLMHCGGTVKTDSQGRFTATGLLVGAEYDFSVAFRNKTNPPENYSCKRIANVIPKNTEVLDLGDLKLKLSE